MKQVEIAKKVNVTQGHLSKVLNKVVRPSWDLAKRLADATNTDPILWMEGDLEQMRSALTQNKSDHAEAVNY